MVMVLVHHSQEADGGWSFPLRQHVDLVGAVGVAAVSHPELVSCLG